MQLPSDEIQQLLGEWRNKYQRTLQLFPIAAYSEMPARLRQHNPQKVIVRPEIEAVWESIVQAGNWQPFDELLQQIQSVKPIIPRGISRLHKSATSE
jgi:uncharacterized protein YdiU (UPF0061 family)